MQTKPEACARRSDLVGPAGPAGSAGKPTTPPGWEPLNAASHVAGAAGGSRAWGERLSFGICRRDFLKTSAIIAAGAALVGARRLAEGTETRSINEVEPPARLAPLDPHIEHLRNAYKSRAEHIFSNLRTALGDRVVESPSARASSPRGGTAMVPWSTYRHLLGTSRQLLDTALANGGDNSVLFRLSVYLRRWQTFAPARDPHVAAVHQAWQDLQKVYLLDAHPFDPKKPTLLFIPGSGVGPFPVFNGLFKELAGSHNIAFFLYDHLEPIASISRRLDECWTGFRSDHGLTRPPSIVSLSYGTTIFRYALLTNRTGLWQNSTLLEIAPVVLGSKYAKWFAAFPLQKSFLQLTVPNLRHWADGVDGKAGPQRFIWGSDSIARLDQVVARRLSLVPERDQHLSSQARHHLVSLLGEGKFCVIKDAKHDPAPGRPEVIAQASKFLI